MRPVLIISSNQESPAPALQQQCIQHSHNNNHAPHRSAGGVQRISAALRLSRKQALAGIAGVAPLVPRRPTLRQSGRGARRVFRVNPTVSPFTGFYKDPEHLEGYRTVKADNCERTLQVLPRQRGTEFVLA